MQVFIIGAHRSGTSAVTKLVEMMGLEAGPARLCPAQPNNRPTWLIAVWHGTSARK